MTLVKMEGIIGKVLLGSFLSVVVLFVLNILVLLALHLRYLLQGSENVTCIVIS